MIDEIGDNKSSLMKF